MSHRVGTCCPVFLSTGRTFEAALEDRNQFLEKGKARLGPVGARSCATGRARFKASFLLFRTCSSPSDGYGSCQSFLDVQARSRESVPHPAPPEPRIYRAARDFSNHRRAISAVALVKP